jgi:hypothetical protein
MATHKIRVVQTDFNAYKAYYKGQLLVHVTAAPFRDSALALMRDGAKPDDTLTAELDGHSSYKILTQKIGKLAGS